MRLLMQARTIAGKSPRLILANIKERILFDLLNGVDTIRQVPKDDYAVKPLNLRHGLHYSSSWTSEIKYGFRVAKKYLAEGFETFDFIDIGCGKAKVQIVWKKMLRKYRLVQNVYGLDYYSDLLDTARINYRKIFRENGNFILADASTFDYGSISKNLILYLYNPFGAIILEDMLKSLIQCRVCLIYNNPVHHQVLVDYGFVIIGEKPGFHPQATTHVYFRDIWA